MGRRAKSDAIDWEAIQKEYSTGQHSIRQLAKIYNIGHAQIAKMVNKHGWVQDKSAEVEAISEAQLLISDTQRDTLQRDKKNPQRDTLNTTKAIPSRTDIEIAALARTNLILGHRADANRARNLVMVLMGELECTTSNTEDFERLGELLVDTVDTDAQSAQKRRLDVFNRVIDTPARIQSVKNLTEALKNAIALERDAFGLDKKNDGGDKSDTNITINNTVQTNLDGYDLSLLSEDELRTYITLREKVEIEVKEVRSIGQ